MTERKRVLVVDDDPAMCELLASALADGQFDVFEAPDGHAAYTLALRVYPDLVISDERMPYLSGTQLLTKLREDPLLGSTPFILLSATHDASQASSSLAKGANEFLPKPFSVEELMARVRRAMVRPPSPTRSVMRGDLRFFPLPDVLVMTHQNRQTGLLRVKNHEGGDRFRFLFEEGSLVWVTGPCEVVGVKAFNRSMRIKEGSFKFTPWASFTRQSWHEELPVNNLLLGGMQEVDEMPLLLRELGGGDKRLEVAPEADRAALEKTGVVDLLLSGEVTSATLTELLDACTEADLDVANALKRLVKEGSLRAAS